MISFVIVTWNCQSEIQGCLESLASSGMQDYETIVIDANSSDLTQDYLSNIEGSELGMRLNLRLRLGMTKKNWAENNREGLRMARGEHIVLSNPDVLFNKDFQKSLELACANPDCFVGPQLVNMDDSGLQYPCKNLDAGQIFYRWTILGSIINRRLLHDYVRRHYLYLTDGFEGVARVEHLTASVFILSRHILDFYGGELWDNTFTWVCADSDMFRRAELLKLPRLHDSRVRLRHEGGYSNNASSSSVGMLENAYGLMEYSRIWGQTSIVRFFLIIDCLILPFWLKLWKKVGFRSAVQTAAYRMRGIFHPSGSFELT